MWTACAAAQEPLTPLMPGARDQCPVCGMLVSKYPNWVAAVRYRDGHAHFFDGAKDMFKYLQALPKYAPGHRATDIRDIQVTEFYGLARIDARKAFYVIGSDVLGPMGHEFVPLESRADAEEFMHDHRGKRILSFDQVVPAIVAEVDGGRVK
ncbi:nitrous oxide reductase accessory protein NosL [Parasulfuritortus cantonensis]|uniref:Nitrous oxide reductase accessory protein NosL n=2 Tax=Parasulfuritortus cantonensis TaxID=2528202 RepID=A0A4R1B0X9_9PROT|nr:nitrous oxide reductase accessory protein NosL [Parasulfuritortus cantonensis]